MTVAVVGASGFIGSAVVEALSGLGHEVRPVHGLRGRGTLLADGGVRLDAGACAGAAQALSGCAAVVNAAGDPDASSTDATALEAANAVLPALLANVLSERDDVRLVHVSSAVVQGRTPTLTASDTTDPFSVYARSKIAGERLVRALKPSGVVVYRPPSVHAPDRRVSRSVVRLASSPLRSVAAPANRPSPQALVQNVASAIAFLATCRQDPPPIVIHPSEGMTTGTLMEVLGGRRPRVLPARPAHAVVRTLEGAGRFSGVLAAHARRVEMMWFGQAQDASWLTTAGWRPPVGPEGWDDLRTSITRQLDGHRQGAAS